MEHKLRWRSLGVLLATVPTVGQAAAFWLPLGTTRDGTRVALDTNSREEIGSLKTVWARYSFSKAANERASYSLKRSEINCEKHTFHIVASTDYAASGKIVFSGETQSTPFVSIVPDSIGARIADLVC